MNAATSLTRRSTSGKVGIELDGLDLGRPLGERDLAQVRDAVDDHHVVFARGQFLTATQHWALAAQFGRLVPSPSERLRGRPGGVSTIEDTAERPPAGFDWHTDLSWTSQPPAFGFLNAVVIPPRGGDTWWVATGAIYDALTLAERAWCDEAAAVHAPDPTLLTSIERHHGADFAARLRDEYPPIHHRLVRTHPRTGRRSLYLSPLYVRRIVGPTGDAPALLARLHAQIDNPEFAVRWKWRAGDIAIWDETSTVHRAATDHYPQRRVMIRCATH